MTRWRAVVVAGTAAGVVDDEQAVSSSAASAIPEALQPQHLPAINRAHSLSCICLLPRDAAALAFGALTGGSLARRLALTALPCVDVGQHVVS